MNPKQLPAVERFTILFKPTQTVVENLEIDDVIEGSRDRMPKAVQGGLPVGVLTDEGGVIFRTPETKSSRSKQWHVGFSDFSFIFNHVPRTHPA